MVNCTAVRPARRAWQVFLCSQPQTPPPGLARPAHARAHSTAVARRAQDDVRMYGGLVALRVLARKYEFMDEVSV